MRSVHHQPLGRVHLSHHPGVHPALLKAESSPWIRPLRDSGSLVIPALMSCFKVRQERQMTRYPTRRTSQGAQTPKANCGLLFDALQCHLGEQPSG